MNSKGYCFILQDTLFHKADRKFSDSWIFQQDNSALYTSLFTKSWVQSFEVDVLDWPGKSPDPNTIENFCGQLARNLYGGERLFYCVAELKFGAQSVRWT